MYSSSCHYLFFWSYLLFFLPLSSSCRPIQPWRCQKIKREVKNKAEKERGTITFFKLPFTEMIKSGTIRLASVHLLWKVFILLPQIVFACLSLLNKLFFYGGLNIYYTLGNIKQTVSIFASIIFESKDDFLFPRSMTHTACIEMSGLPHSLRLHTL